MAVERFALALKVVDLTAEQTVEQAAARKSALVGWKCILTYEDAIDD